MSDPVLAIDIGGTKIALAVVDDEGALLAEAVRPTIRATDPEAVFAPAADGIREILGRVSVAVELRVGIGSAGPIDGPAGTISPVNIAAWREFPVRQRVTDVLRELGLTPQVALAGDGHCFALGEHWLGAGRDVDSMVGLVLSTGVGGGAVLDNRLFAGRTGNAVHLGHISVNAWGPRCVCGGHGCTEMYARGPALVAAAHDSGWTGGDDAQALTADARAGDPIAVEVIDRGMRALAAGIATTATELDVHHVRARGWRRQGGRRHLRASTPPPA